MNKIFTLITLLTLGFTAKATIHVVSVSNFAFSPANLTSVIVGDTVRFTWVSGTHTTTSVTQSIPANAAVWNSPITSANPTFDYKVTVAGTYSYVCTPHAGSMTGSFVASLPVLSASKIQKSTELKVYPNPFTSKVTINHGGADKIEVCSLLGETVASVSVSTYEKSTVLDLSDLRKGVYFYIIKSDGKVLETRKIVKSE